MPHTCNKCKKIFNSQNPAVDKEGKPVCWDCSDINIDGSKKVKKESIMFRSILESVIKADKIIEGRTKHALEDKVAKKCNCDGGMSLDPDEHDKDCPALEYLKDLGSDIDAAEYQMSDR